jgi:hypothetical protein
VREATSPSTLPPVAESRNERILGVVHRVLNADEQVEARGVCWAAVRRPKVPLLVLGRHQYDVVLTDRRILMFSRRHHRHLRPDDVAFAKRYAALTLESAGGGFPLTRHHIVTDTGRRLVVEWRPRHRALARRLAAALAGSRASAAG